MNANSECGQMAATADKSLPRIQLKCSHTTHTHVQNADFIYFFCNLFSIQLKIWIFKPLLDDKNITNTLKLLIIHSKDSCLLSSKHLNG
jgi:hypothetical protein